MWGDLEDLEDFIPSRLESIGVVFIRVSHTLTSVFRRLPRLAGGWRMEYSRAGVAAGTPVRPLQESQQVMMVAWIQTGGGVCGVKKACWWVRSRGEETLRLYSRFLAWAAGGLASSIRMSWGRPGFYLLVRGCSKKGPSLGRIKFKMYLTRCSKGFFLFSWTFSWSSKLRTIESIAPIFLRDTRPTFTWHLKRWPKLSLQPASSV